LVNIGGTIFKEGDRLDWLTLFLERQNRYKPKKRPKPEEGQEESTQSIIEHLFS
jgi:hypothetical protein